MLKKIKMLLFGKKLAKPKNYIEKIDYLLLNKLDYFTEDTMRLTLSTLEDDIYKYVRYLSLLVKSDFINSYVNVKNVNNNTLKEISVARWFSNNGTIENTDEVYQEWLRHSKELLKIYYVISKDMSNHTTYGNAIKIQPYIINIERIVDILLSLEIK